MEGRLVSIVLPVYNGQKYLAQSIESVLSQTYKNIELIIVNDCSTDNSLSIVQEYAAKDSRVKIIINQKNQKLPMSLNIGFKAASGDYYTWTSDDNFYYKEAIEKMVNYLESNSDIDLVACDYDAIDANDNLLNHVHIDNDSKNLIKQNTIGACFLYKKEIAQKIGEYDKTKFLVEDYDYWLRLGLAGKIGVLNECLYTYRYHNSSLTTRRMEEILVASANLMDEYLERYVEKCPELKKDKTLKKEYYRKLKKLAFATGEKVYCKKIAKLGLGYRFKAMSLKSKLKKRYKEAKKQNQYERQIFTIDRFEKALKWIEKYTIDNKGIVVESEQPEKIYPEVTGYYIPTLLRWGEKERAKNFADYLLTIQNEDGSWNEPSGQIAYTFDTGQILKGLWEFIDEDEKYKTAFFKGCDWILTQQREDGSIATPNYSWWDLPYGKKVPEAIHIYCLEPLKKAAERFGIEKYNNCVEKALKFYLAQDNLTDFNTLSHFHAYIIEGLIDIGEIERARKAMEEIAKIQRKDGSVPAYSHVKFVCSTGLFQYAICWFKLGEKELGNKAFAYAASLQNESGGFYGTYGKKSNYFKYGEISWAVKYFLDAIYFSQTCSYNQIYDIFPDSIDPNDGRLLTVDKAVAKFLPKTNLDLGCGKGRFSKELIKKYPGREFYGMDISKEILEFTPSELKTKQGVLLNIPFDNASFDFIFCVEALEHAININGAIKEIARVLKPNGKVLIIDKNIKALGQLELAPWEQWFDSEGLKEIMQKNGLDVSIEENIPYDVDNKQDELFTAWTGHKQ